MPDKSPMLFDPVIAHPGRLRILAALAVEPTQDFVILRGRTRLTDGNLASHARRLESAGLIAIRKHFRNEKPVTSFTLTPAGRAALERHAHELLAALAPPESPDSSPAEHTSDQSALDHEYAASADEEWID